MNELKIQDQTLDSRDVAEMMEVNHYDLTRKIKTHIEYLVDGGESNFTLSDFFTETNYLSEQNKELPNYQISRKGCELLAHKMTGRKGTQFTAKYINKFHAMEKHIVAGISIAEMRASFESIAEDIVSRKVDEIELKASELYRPSHSQKLNICRYIKNRLGVGQTDDEYDLVKERVLIKLNGGKWEDVPAETLRDSLNIIDESIRVVKLDRQVNQISLFE